MHSKSPEEDFLLNEDWKRYCNAFSRAARSRKYNEKSGETRKYFDSVVEFINKNLTKFESKDRIASFEMASEFASFAKETEDLGCHINDQVYQERYDDIQSLRKAAEYLEFPEEDDSLARVPTSKLFSEMGDRFRSLSSGISEDRLKYILLSAEKSSLLSLLINLNLSKSL